MVGFTARLPVKLSFTLGLSIQQTEGVIIVSLAEKLKSPVIKKAKGGRLSIISEPAAKLVSSQCIMVKLLPGNQERTHVNVDIAAALIPSYAFDRRPLDESRARSIPPPCGTQSFRNGGISFSYVSLCRCRCSRPGWHFLQVERSPCPAPCLFPRPWHSSARTLCPLLFGSLPPWRRD